MLKMLFIKGLVEADYGALEKDFFLILIMWGLVFIAICIDLVSGVTKAKERGEVRTSVGYRKTVSKFIKYYSVMLFALLIDALISVFYNAPIATTVTAGYLIFIEAKSVCETADDKITKHVPEYVAFIKELKKHGCLDAFQKLVNNELGTSQDSETTEVHDR